MFIGTKGAANRSTQSQYPRCVLLVRMLTHRFCFTSMHHNTVIDPPFCWSDAPATTAPAYNFTHGCITFLAQIEKAWLGQTIGVGFKDLFKDFLPLHAETTYFSHGLRPHGWKIFENATGRAASTGQAECEVCPLGKFAKPGSVSCSACPAGFVATEDRSDCMRPGKIGILDKEPFERSCFWSARVENANQFVEREFWREQECDVIVSNWRMT